MIHRRRGFSSTVQRRFQAHFSALSPVFLRIFVILLTGTVLTSQSKKLCDLNPLCRIKYEIQPFSEFGQKKRPLDTLNHRTLVYSHGIKSCDSCASKRHLSRVTLYITLQALLLLPCCSSPYICAFPSTVFCRSGFVHRSHPDSNGLCDTGTPPYHMCR